jgi:uncharacterized protein YecT (DUF1311 family)
VATLLFAQLKEAQMQRQEARDKASREQDTINSMQAQLDKEDADLNEARTHTRTHGHQTQHTKQITRTTNTTNNSKHKKHKTRESV